MIKFERSVLNNGLKVLVNEDFSTPLAAVNIMYDVGSSDEDPENTGFAHLFEHFMFAGSENIPKYDEPLERVGGQNNAFTNSDITNYYCTLPVQNIETAFCLESDRMLNLLFTEKNLEIQKSVVIEEFKQNYLNQPYGDVWLHLRPLAYKVHPYKWSTIGKNTEHIRNASMDNVRAFYKKFYNPCNAVLTVAGGIKADLVFELAEKWFGSVRNNGIMNRLLPEEPVQEIPRILSLKRDVPLEAIYKVFHMCSRTDPNYYVVDLISDILSNGDSSRLYQILVKKKKIFNNISAYVTGDRDAGLFVISGNLNQNVSMKKAEDAINIELDKLKDEMVDDQELIKVKNKIESSLIFSESNTLNRAINLSYYEILKNASMINELTDMYQKVEINDIKSEAVNLFDKNNCSTLYYTSDKK